MLATSFRAGARMASTCFTAALQTFTKGGQSSCCLPCRCNRASKQRPVPPMVVTVLLVLLVLLALVLGARWWFLDTPRRQRVFLTTQEEAP